MSGWWLLVVFVCGALFGAVLASWYFARCIHFLGLSGELAVRTLGELASRAVSSK